MSAVGGVAGWNGPKRTHVVVVGGGFAGTRAAERLARLRQDVYVTLLDRTNHHTFSPLLYQVATAGLSAQDVARSLRALTAKHTNVQVRLDEVTAVDRHRRRLSLAGGQVLSYDHLLLASGSVTADFGVPGVNEHALPLKSVSDAVRLRDHVLHQFERASATHAPDALTIVVAGGGPTGVEMAGAVAELANVLVTGDFASLTSQPRIVLVERLDTLLPSFAPTSRRYAAKALERLGVELRLGVGVERVLHDRLELDDGTVLPTRTLIWTAGVRASPLLRGLEVPLDLQGRALVEPDLSLPGHPEISVVGDAASVADSDGRPLPQIAPAAMQQGRHAATQILRRIDGLPTQPFSYQDKGSMATIGRNAAVNEYPGGIRLRGRLAWIAWLLLHLAYLAGVRNRLSTLLTWLWNYVTFDRSLRVLLGPGHGPNRANLESSAVATHIRTTPPHTPLA